MTKILLLGNSETENSTAVVEVMRALNQRGVKLTIVVDKYPSPNNYYLSSKLNNYIILDENTKHAKISKINIIKNIIRKIPKLEKKLICVQVLCQGILLYFKNKGKNNCVLKTFLSTKMLNIKIDDSHDCIWAIDEVSLLWAEYINSKSKVKLPIVYHCLELYWEHYMNTNNKWKDYRGYLLYSKAKDILEHTSHVLIQDLNRWKSLCKCTGLNENRSHTFVPVTIRDYNVKGNNLLQVINNFNREKKIIFYPTLLAEKRGCVELINMSKGVNENFLVVIHGYAAIPGFVSRLQKSSVKGNVIISNDNYSYEDLIGIHRDIWCGFLYYTERDDNNKYIVNSSNKLVMFLQAGKPIITAGNETLRELCEKYECGISLKECTEEQFKEAIKKIDDNYEEYAYNARKCYEERYNIDLYLEVLCKDLEKVM